MEASVEGSDLQHDDAGMPAVATEGDEVGSGEFGKVKARLDEIVEAVSAEDISLDDALELYEEAVKLGMKASSLLEEKIG